MRQCVNSASINVANEDSVTGVTELGVQPAGCLRESRIPVLLLLRWFLHLGWMPAVGSPAFRDALVIPRERVPGAWGRQIGS